VIRKHLGIYIVDVGGDTVQCSISNRLRKRLIYPIADPSSLYHRVVAVKDVQVVDPIAIGDHVQFVPAGGQEGMITEVLPRRNKLVRTTAGRKPLEQIIAANVDQIVIAFAAARPAPKWNLLDRYLAAAESAGIPALVCITKLDLVEPGELAEDIQLYRDLGYDVLLTSAVTGEGIEALRQALTNRTSVLIGKSGVGKTSLLNALQPGLGQRVGDVGHGEVGKGRHTTTHLELFALEAGGGLIDTPGMREFALWDITQDELALLFPEMRDLVGQCKFGLDCTHRSEPGCAILQAVEAGAIAERRYQSMLRLMDAG
jgi:ribosome biogenesis GTPase